MFRTRCPSCGSLTSSRNRFCPACGTPMPAQADPAGTRSRAGSLRAVWVVLTAIGIIGAATVGYEWRSFEIAAAPAEVSVTPGLWVVEYNSFPNATAGPAYPGTATVSPSGTFELTLVIQVEGGCPRAPCGGYNVTGIVVEPPFILMHWTPDALPRSISQNESATWSLTVQAPRSSGTFGLNGEILGATY